MMETEEDFLARIEKSIMLDDELYIYDQKRLFEVYKKQVEITEQLKLRLARAMET